MKITAAMTGSAVHVIYRPAISQSDGSASMALRTRNEAFQRKYCAGCGKVSCDDGSPCPYEDKRNNPLWWLSQESGKAAEV